MPVPPFVRLFAVLALIGLLCAPARAQEPDLPDPPEEAPAAPVNAPDQNRPAAKPEPAGEAHEIPVNAPHQPSPNTEPETAEDTPKAPGSGLPLRGLMWRLDKYMQGQRIMALGYGVMRPDVAWSDALFHGERSIVGKLQRIAEKQSSDEDPLIPFQVGTSYMVAPEMREDVNPNLGQLSPLDVTEPGALFEQALLTLSADQVKALNARNGIALSELPETARTLFQHAVRPPLDIVRRTKQTMKNDEGVPHSVFSDETLASVTEPLDGNSVRVRAALRVYGVHIEMEPYGTLIGTQEGGVVLSRHPNRAGFRDYSGVELPLYTPVANTYKPSDLDGRRFKNPIGLEGVWTVAQVKPYLEKATGLRLAIWKPFGSQPMFLGSASIPAGDVLDALRLGLCGAWRRLGDTYLLAWDRRGLRAAATAAREAAANTTQTVTKRRQESFRNPKWVTLADNLAFDEADPLALTDEQREILYPTRPADDPRAPIGTVTFHQMTPAQQAYVRKLAENDSVYVHSGEDTPPAPRPITEAEIQNASVGHGVRIALQFQIPGHGWVGLNDDMNPTSLNPWLIRNARSAEGGKKRDVLEEMPQELRDMLTAKKPSVMRSRTRVMVVPALGAARLETLAREMKRHGFNTLFYPALTGGYATFPSQQFPPHPALRGEDGLEAAVTAMKSVGVRVVPYLSTLAWQEEENRVHWLNRYPEWLDVDALGRTRLAFLANHPEPGPMLQAQGGIAANFVRPGEPKVVQKLEGLLAETARRADTKGVAFFDWRPMEDGGSMMPSLPGMAVPVLGFALADRIAAFRKTGEDPIDTLAARDVAPRSLSTVYVGGSPFAPPSVAHAVLLSRLVQRARSLRKDWTIYATQAGEMGTPGAANGKTAPDASGKPDVTLAVLFGGALEGGDVAPHFVITRRNFFQIMLDAGEGPGGGTEVPEQLLQLPALAVYTVFLGAEARLASRIFPAMAYDFRFAPETITESMTYVKAPGPKELGPEPAPKPAAAPPAAPKKPAPPRRR